MNRLAPIQIQNDDKTQITNDITSTIEETFHLSEEEILILLVAFLLMQENKFDHLLLIAFIFIFLDIDLGKILNSLFNET